MAAAPRSILMYILITRGCRGEPYPRFKLFCERFKLNCERNLTNAWRQNEDCLEGVMLRFMRMMFTMTPSDVRSPHATHFLPVRCP